MIIKSSNTRTCHKVAAGQGFPGPRTTAQPYNHTTSAQFFAHQAFTMPRGFRYVLHIPCIFGFISNCSGRATNEARSSSSTHPYAERFGVHILKQICRYPIFKLCTIYYSCGLPYLATRDHDSNTETMYLIPNHLLLVNVINGWSSLVIQIYAAQYSGYPETHM